MTTYAFSNSAPRAKTQLDCLQGLLDRQTVAVLTERGLPGNARCWEIGAGGGSIARWLAGRARGARVLATDVDTTWIESTIGIDVAHHDVTAEVIPAGPFDLIHARLVLLHLPDRRELVGRLARSLAPGGWLVLEEFDCAAPLPVLCSAGEGDAALFTRVQSAILAVLSARGASMTWAYEAYAAMAEAGLTDLGATTYADAATAGSLGARLHEVNSHQLEDALASQGIADTELAAFRQLMHDPTFAAMTYPLVSTWGRA